MIARLLPALSLGALTALLFWLAWDVARLEGERACVGVASEGRR